MLREMRRQDRAMDAAQMSDVLERGEYGVLASVGADGHPYAVPYSYAVLDDSIYIHCTSEAGHNRENLSHNSTVCFTVVGRTEVLPEKFTTDYESVVVFGHAREVNDPQNRKRAIMALLDKYSNGYQDRGLKYYEAVGDSVAIIEIEPIKVTGKMRRKAAMSSR